MTKDYCALADVFYGNGEVDHFAKTGLASKWFYIKALCGNTLPHATLPFGKMSVGAYSSGYPTGYGTHYPNSCGGIRKLGDTMQIRGFSHLHQSGTGAIQFYYNYAVTTPFYGSLENAFCYGSIADEQAKPGFYSVRFNDTLCRLTVDGGTAFHSYTFERDGGRIAVDFSNDGLSHLFGEQFYAYVQDAHLTAVSADTVLCDGIFSGVRLYFCVRVCGEAVRCRLFADSAEIDKVQFTVSDNQKPFGAVFDMNGRQCGVFVTYSTVSAEKAQAACLVRGNFEETAQKAYNIWNEHLSRIDIDAPEDIQRKFYSCLYHSLIKPCDMTGERILDVEGACVSDIATFWDQYKTALPLLYTVYGEMGKKTADAIVNISRTHGRLHGNFGLSIILPCEEQAKCLGVISLCDAYDVGLVSKEVVAECMERELRRDDFRSFTENGLFERYTHILDAADACADTARITGSEKLRALSDSLYNAYDDDGILSENSPYYEGDRYTYSFRMHPDMEKRMALSGGRENFVRQLDDFFGYNGESVQPIRDLYGAYEKIAATQYHRFEGFNNEPDMEVPYCYIFAGRHDRTAEIIRESVHVSFGTGKGGLPGNNDSGGLSSCFVWNVLGLFPASGTGNFLIGSPQLKKAAVRLSNEKILTVEAAPTEAGAWWNGEPLAEYILPTAKLMQGGTLKIGLLEKSDFMTEE